MNRFHVNECKGFWMIGQRQHVQSYTVISVYLYLPVTKATVYEAYVSYFVDLCVCSYINLRIQY